MKRTINRFPATIIVVLAACMLAVVALMLVHGARTESKDVEAARRILPGYNFVFEERTNEIRRCWSEWSFSRQHEMMAYLQIMAPYIETYHHPKDRPIMVYERERTVIVELPSRFLFEPYNWKIFWGSYYQFHLEIDKETKQIVEALQG